MAKIAQLEFEIKTDKDFWRAFGKLRKARKVWTTGRRRKRKGGRGALGKQRRRRAKVIS